MKRYRELVQQWHGKVVRRDPRTYQLPSILLTWFCRRCRSWTMHGAWRYGRCNWCDAERPTQ